MPSGLGLDPDGPIWIVVDSPGGPLRPQSPSKIGSGRSIVDQRDKVSSTTHTYQSSVGVIAHIHSDFVRSTWAGFDRPGAALTDPRLNMSLSERPTVHRRAAAINSATPDPNTTGTRLARRQRGLPSTCEIHLSLVAWLVPLFRRRRTRSRLRVATSRGSTVPLSSRHGAPGSRVGEAVESRWAADGRPGRPKSRSDWVARESRLSRRAVWRGLPPREWVTQLTRWRIPLHRSLSTLRG